MNKKENVQKVVVGIDYEQVMGKIAVGSIREFGNYSGLDIDIYESGIKVSMKDGGFFGAQATLTIRPERTDLTNKKVLSYDINYASSHKSAKQADQMSFILGKLASIAKDIEALGVTTEQY